MRALTIVLVAVTCFVVNTPIFSQGLFESTGEADGTENGIVSPLTFSGHSKGAVSGGRNSAGKAVISGTNAQLSLKLAAQKSGIARAFAEVRFNAGRFRDSSVVAFDLREAWGSVSPGPFDITLGHQIISWGRADAINPTNVITPKDETYLSGEFDDTRLGNELLHIKAKIGQTNIQGVWIPCFRPDVLPLTKAIIPAGVKLGDTFYPDNRFENGGFALRMEFFLPSVDGSISYFNGYPTLPGFDYALSQTGVALIPHAYRTQSAGADFSTTIGQFGVRGEAALKYPFDDYEKHVFVPLPFVQYVLGFDRSFGDWNMLLQYSGLYTIRYADITDPVLTDPFSPMGQALYASERAKTEFQRLNRLFTGTSSKIGHAVTGNAQWSAFHETVRLKLAGMYNFTTEDYAINPSVSYDIADAVNLSVGGRYLSGPTNSLNDMLRDLMSFVYTEVKVSF